MIMDIRSPNGKVSVTIAPRAIFILMVLLFLVVGLFFFVVNTYVKSNDPVEAESEIVDISRDTKKSENNEKESATVMADIDSLKKEGKISREHNGYFVSEAYECGTSYCVKFSLDLDQDQIILRFTDNSFFENNEYLEKEAIVPCFLQRENYCDVKTPSLIQLFEDDYFFE